jgi:hypothetical protein
LGVSKLTQRIELKVSEETMAALLAIEVMHKTSPAVVCRALADLAAEHFRLNKRCGFPLVLMEPDAKLLFPAKIDIPRPDLTPHATGRLAYRATQPPEGETQIPIGKKVLKVTQKQQRGAKDKRADKPKKPGDHDTKTSDLKM